MCRYGRGPLFFGVVGLALESGGQRVAEELSALAQEKGLAGGEGAPQRSLGGLRFQFGGQVEGHLGDLTLQRRFGQQRRFRHFPSSFWLGNPGNLIPALPCKCQAPLTHDARTQFA
jgi:hypothetical protein